MVIRHHNNHAAIILASGLSRRLGQPKQLLRIGGETLISYMTKLALLSQPKIIVVVVPNSPAIIDSLTAFAHDNNTHHSSIKIVINPSPEKGMSESLRLGIQTLKAVDEVFISSVLIMGIDQILLKGEHLTELLEEKNLVVASHYHHLDKNHCRVVSRGSIIGLPIVINYQLLKQWQSSLIGDKGLRHLIRALPSNQLSSVVNPSLSHDIDTPEQLAYAQQNNWIDD